MNKISNRHKIAAIELTSNGIGVSTSARKYVRQMVPEITQMRNSELNEKIASDFSKAERLHRFKLRSGEIAEIRKSTNFYYIAVIRGRGTAATRLDIIVIQPAYKMVPDEIRKKRLEPGWGVS